MIKRVLLIVFVMVSIGHESYSSQSSSKEISFVNQQGDTLYGNLILPSEDFTAKVPVIIFWSVPHNPLTTLTTKGFKKNFDNLLLVKGIALCYFNKPGMGRSSGKWYRQSFQDRTNDVKSCIDFLKQLSLIDETKIGVVGHSQGGWIAQLVAAQFGNEIAFAISMAGPSYSVKKQLITDFTSSFTCKGIEKSIALKKAHRKTNLVYTMASIFPFSQNLKQLQRIKGYSPEKSISKLTIPFLFLFGENDRLVDHGWCHDSFQLIFGLVIPVNIQIKVIQDVNHSFEIHSFCSDTRRKDLNYS